MQLRSGWESINPVGLSFFPNAYRLFFDTPQQQQQQLLGGKTNGRVNSHHFHSHSPSLN